MSGEDAKEIFGLMIDDPARVALVLWDGDCDLCARAVRWARARDHTGQLAFVPHQNVPEPPMTAALRRACVRAVHLVTAEGQVLRAGRATLFILARAGWPRLARVAALLPLRWLVELAYWTVARHRRLFGRLLFRR